jgi:hypothetical protein
MYLLKHTEFSRRLSLCYLFWPLELYPKNLVYDFILTTKPPLENCLEASSLPVQSQSGLSPNRFLFDWLTSILKLVDFWHVAEFAPPIHHIFIKFFVPFGNKKIKNMARPGLNPRSIDLTQ